MSTLTLQKPRTLTRLVGAGLVLLLHVVFVWGLFNGLAHRVVALIQAPIEARVVQEQTVKAPEPAQKLKPALPEMSVPQAIQVPPPEFEIAASPSNQALSAASPQSAQTGSAGSRVSADKVCTSMGKPEIPPLAREGSVLFLATARVSDGQVVESNVRRLSGELNRREQGLLVRAIQTALRDTYVCPGATEFQQEFQVHFR